MDGEQTATEPTADQTPTDSVDNSSINTEEKTESGDVFENAINQAEALINQNSAENKDDLNSSNSEDPSTDKTPDTKTEPTTAPDHWSQEAKDQFAKLPESAQQLLIGMNDDLGREFDQKMQGLAQERQNLVNRFGLQEEQIRDLATRVQAFQSDPTSVISQLAEEAGIPIFFKDPAPSAEPPEFENQAEMLKWLQEQNRNEARQIAADESKRLRQEQIQQAQRTQFKSEFQQAMKDHPDLMDHKDGIAKYTREHNLPLKLAYRLATYDSLAKLAGQGQSGEAEINKLKSELEKFKKQSTRPPASGDIRSAQSNDSEMDIYERAYSTAEKVTRTQ